MHLRSDRYGQSLDAPFEHQSYRYLLLCPFRFRQRHPIPCPRTPDPKFRNHQPGRPSQRYLSFADPRLARNAGKHHRDNSHLEDPLAGAQRDQDHEEYEESGRDSYEHEADIQAVGGLHVEDD